MITKKQAHLLSAYEFKLVDETGKEAFILEYSNGYFEVEYDGGCMDVSVNSIGVDYFILCRPYSQLTEEIEHGGERFVPIIPICKKIADIHNDDMDDKFKYYNDGRVLVKTPWDLRFEMFYKTHDFAFSVYDTWNVCEKRTRNQEEAIDFLLTWNFKPQWLEKFVKYIENE